MSSSDFGGWSPDRKPVFTFTYNYYENLELEFGANDTQIREDFEKQKEMYGPGSPEGRN